MRTYRVSVRSEKTPHSFGSVMWNRVGVSPENLPEVFGLALTYMGLHGGRVEVTFTPKTQGK